MVTLKFVGVESGPELEEIRTLFLEYAKSLNFNLCFQSFDEELKRLPGEYVSLVLCQVEGKSAGCIGMKPIGPGVCEMKRLFVRPEFRGRELGRKLVTHLIDEA